MGIEGSSETLPFWGSRKAALCGGHRGQLLSPAMSCSLSGTGCGQRCHPVCPFSIAVGAGRSSVQTAASRFWGTACSSQAGREGALGRGCQLKPCPVFWRRFSVRFYPRIRKARRLVGIAPGLGREEEHRQSRPSPSRAEATEEGTQAGNKDMVFGGLDRRR